MQTKILSEFKYFNGIPTRINKKWQFILKNSWEDLFDYSILVEECNFYLGEYNDLTMSLSLPSIENHDSPFKDDLFMISLIAIDIKYSGDIQLLIGKNINNLYFSIYKIEESIFKICINLHGYEIDIFSSEIFISGLFKKENEIYRFVY